MPNVIDFILGWTKKPDQNEILPREGRNPQMVVSDAVERAKEQHDKFLKVVASAGGTAPGSERLQEHASIIIELALRAREPPCTHFMPDIAESVLRLMNELLLYAQYEAGNFIFRLFWNMQREERALEGKMQALRVLIEAELEWKRKEGHART